MMSYVRLQDSEGQDLVTINLSDGAVEVLSPAGVSDAARTFWGAIASLRHWFTGYDDVVLHGAGPREDGLPDGTPGDIILRRNITLTPGAGAESGERGGDVIVTPEVELDPATAGRPQGRKFYGMEFRGLLGDILDDIVVTPSGDRQFFVKAIIRATCVETFFPRREVIISTTVEIIDEIPAVNGITLTDEQRAIHEALRYLLLHEFDEDLWVDGKRVTAAEHFRPRALQFEQRSSSGSQEDE